jgi:hypothetical protein
MATTTLSARAFLEHLLECNSLAVVHETITVWLRANPPPKSRAEIEAHVDDVLAGAYQRCGDPRPRITRREDLVSIVERLVAERDMPLGPRAWLFDWLMAPHPALAAHCPDDLLDSSEGVDQARQLLERGHQ